MSPIRPLKMKARKKAPKMNEFHFDFDCAMPVSEGTEQTLLRVARCCLAAEGVTQPCMAYLRFSDDADIHQINREQRNVDRATDVLSFPAGPFNPRHTAGHCPKTLHSLYDPQERACRLGDIIISLDHARAQAAEYGHSFERELCYLTAHALFHLMGYDHMNDQDKSQMRRMEEKAMNEAGISRVSDDELLALAAKAMQYSYSPYSKFKVGACLLAADGRVFTGCNIENASYGATNCAERTALFKAVSEGAHEFVAIAIATEKALAWPCGICRQALCEFAPHLRVITACGAQRAEATLDQLLYGAFGPVNGTGDYLGKD